MALTLTSTLGIGLKSLQTSQASLGTVAQNIANVNTEGYTRQQVIAGNVAIEGFGSGVTIVEIRRVADEVLSNRITDQKSDVSYATTTRDFMANLEVIFGTPGSASSTEKLVNKLFNEMGTLANSPNSSSLKLNAIETTKLVVETVRSIGDQLDASQLLIDKAIDKEIVAVNQALKNIKQLNDEIVALSVGGMNGANPNDLLDERQRQVDIVAKRLNVNSSFDELGRLRLISATGRRLVDTSYTELERISATNGALFDDVGVRTVKPDGTPSVTVYPLLTDKMDDGSIKAYIDMRDTEIPNLKAELNEFSRVLISVFNDLHSQGTPVPPPNSLESGNGYLTTGAGVDITLPTELGLTPGESFDISVVVPETGDVISGLTTSAAGGGTTSITIGASPYTLADLAASINANPDLAGQVIASTTIDANGDEQLKIAATNPANAIVLGNVSGNPLGKLGMNNFFTGNSADNIAIREDIMARPELIATARMRASDGGVSFNDNRNIIEISKLSQEPVNFNAAGSLSAKTINMSGYFTAISSNLAVNLKDNEGRLDFSQTVLDDMESRLSAVSGVNMDEELANMLLFQNSYQASARVITVIDELFETLVNLI